MENEQQRGLVSREPPKTPDVFELSDVETDIQGEIQEYHERAQRNGESAELKRDDDSWLAYI